jgi:hypothetical protein
MKYKLFILILFTFSCTSKSSDELVWAKLKLYKNITTLQDSLFLFDVQNMRIQDSILFLASPNMDKIFLLSSELKYISSFGNTGDGPGDFIEPFSLFIEDKIVWVGDKMHPEIDAYRFDGEFVGSYKTPEAQSVFFGQFVKIDDDFFFHSISEKGSIIRYNEKLDSSFYFGGFYGDKKNRQSKIFHDLKTDLHLYNDKILTVNCQNGTIEIYTADGVLENSFSFDLLITNFYDYIENHVSATGKKSDAYSMVINSYVEGDELYLLVTSRVEKRVDEFSPNKVVKINIKKEEIQDYFELPGKVYNAILTKGDQLFAYNAQTNALEAFFIP